MLNIIKIMRSPCCRMSMGYAGAEAVCGRCGRRYLVKGNVVQLAGPDRGASVREKEGRFLAFMKTLLRFIRDVHSNKLDAYYTSLLTDINKAQDIRRRHLQFLGDKKRCTILDFGCGRGRMCALLALLGHDVVGVDSFVHDFWRKIKGAEFVSAGQETPVPFADKTFDACFHYMVLGYLQDPLEHLKEIRRVLKSGGHLNIQVANKNNLYTRFTGRFVDKTYRLLSLKELEAVLKSAGFTTVSVSMERFYAPIFPQTINYVRYLLAKKYDPFFDRDSFFVRMTPPQSRAIINLVARV